MKKLLYIVLICLVCFSACTDDNINKSDLSKNQSGSDINNNSNNTNNNSNNDDSNSNNDNNTNSGTSDLINPNSGNSGSGNNNGSDTDFDKIFNIINTQQEDVKPSFTHKTVWLPGGEFVTNDGNRIEMKPFGFSKSHVSISQYWQCLKNQQCSLNSVMSVNLFKPYLLDLSTDQTAPDIDAYMEDPETGIKPVFSIKIQGAKQFCEWIGGHLATENEWAYAALYGQNGLREVDYPWGDLKPVRCEEVSYTDVDAFYPYCKCTEEYIPRNQFDYGIGMSCKDSSAHVAGITPLGIIGMAGDIADMVADSLPSNPSLHILKGGSYASDLEHIKIRSREYDNEDDPDDYLGPVSFRCAFDAQ